MTIRPIRSVLALLLLATACGDPTGSGRGVPEANLVFLRFADGAPAPLDTTLTFWATRGENTEVRIRMEDGEDLLRFRLRPDALRRYPDGRTFRMGDSVQISLRLSDDDRFLFRFEPSGLEFSPDEPAELEISYLQANPDLDGDGTAGDPDDDRIAESFAIWRQERAGDPWERIATARLRDLQEVRAELTGFTRYALASN